ncbi:MAG: hypothetical protein JNL17_11805 [Cyclobacteriaceae bacterium]|nr:hypothetical protein [Cyclobacteriaceae bacterium]
MDRKVFKCLVASPGDTAVERRICESIFEELNQSLGVRFGFVIEKRMWEHNTRPGFGEYPQAVVSAQLGYDYDIFIGIMNNRFGTETKVAGSGTEEEFNNAYQRILKKEPVQIMFYFNDEPIKKSAVDPNEILRINAFKRKISDLGGYHWSYNGAQDFEKTLRVQVTQYFLDQYNINPTTSTKENVQAEMIRVKLEERLNLSLKAFSSQPIIWVDPILSKTNEISTNPTENYENRYKPSELIANPISTIVKAPPQFGLTCLAHYLVSQAWNIGDIWVYIDSQKTKSHNIHNAANREIEALGLAGKPIKAIVLDSWSSSENDSIRKLKNLCDSYPTTPIIVMHTIDDARFHDETHNVSINREFKILHLLALPRTQIRKVVSEYVKAKGIGAEDKVLSKVLSDMEVLNIHRTPMNCLTLLKVSEKYFDESPVNRTNLIEMILFVLFTMDSLHRYKTKPDLKDCEHVLGHFCEMMIRKETYLFSKEKFMTELQAFCKSKLIDLEIESVFEILCANNIIVRRDVDFGFRSSYWVFYFAAKRMHYDPGFAKYIFESKKYIAFPEIIEFYTGINRNSNNALEVLIKDIRETCDTVTSKVKFPEDMNPFAHIKWQPTEEQIQLAQNALSDGVKASGLPDTIKDQHADKSYNQIRPYNQSIQKFFAEYSVYNLMQNIRAASRALRNSDYGDPDLKRQIFNEIVRSWQQVSRVLLALTPILADRGRAQFEGQAFFLNGNFGDTFEERVKKIILVNMMNVVRFFKDDIFSSKLGPLFFEFFQSEKDENQKHKIALLIISTRPRGWRKEIEDYITSLSKNSFYLFDIKRALSAKYSYDFTTEEEVREIGYLIKMCLAKHEFGTKKPTLNEISKITLTPPTKGTDS